MGKIVNWCLETGETEQQWKARDNKVSKRATEGASLSLPAPYNRRVEGQKEAPILKALLDGLMAAGVWCTRIENSGKVIHGKSGMVMIPSAQTGLPDVLACFKGRFVAFECKAPGGKLSAAQHGKMLALNHAGALVAVVVDPAKAIDWLLNGSEATATMPSGIQVL